jgi:hypothetical protein
MNGEPLVLRYELTPEEVAAAMVDHIPAGRSQVRNARVLAFVFGPGLVALMAAVGGSVLAVLPPALLASGLLLWGTTRGRRIAGVLNQVRGTPSYTAPTTIAVEGDGLRVRSAVSDSWYSWRYWESVASTPDGVSLVLRGGWGLLFIPARAFAPDGQQAAWAATVGLGIGPQPAPA